MRKAGVVGVAITVLCAAGSFEAVQSARRADPERAQAVQARLDAIPSAVGAWTGRAGEFDAKPIRQAGAVAYAYQVYTRPRTNDEIQVLILAGDPGEIGAHDPNRCYAGAGFRPIGQQVRRDVPGLPDAYWSARFDSDTFPAASLQVNWAWTADGTWAAADDARVEYVGRPVLYKLYVTRRLAPADGSAADPTREFLVEFLPAVRTALSAPAR